MTIFNKKSEVEKTYKDSPQDRYMKRVLLSELIAQSESKKNKSVSDQLKLRNLKRTYSLLYGESFYCPALASNLPKYQISRCIFCQSGHIGSCHYPFDFILLIYYILLLLNSQHQMFYQTSFPFDI